MKRKKKQLLGFAGLVAVAIMTAVAYCLPTPDAAAVAEPYACDPSIEGDCATDESGINLQVVINEATTSVAIVAPQNNSTVVGQNVKFSTNFNEVTRIDYYLTHKKADGTTERINLPSYTPPAGTTSGTHDFEYDLSAYDYGNYQFHVTGYGGNNAVREDVVEFNYNAIQISDSGTTAANKDPIVRIEANDQVDKILVHVYDKDGNPVMVDESGNEIPLEVSRDEIDPNTGLVLITLPFERYGAEPGEYNVVAVAYNDRDEVISMAHTMVTYAPGAAVDPNVPETPNTGSGLFADLNITRVDYLITGLIIFALASALGLYLVWSKSRR